MPVIRQQPQLLPGISFQPHGDRGWHYAVVIFRHNFRAITIEARPENKHGLYGFSGDIWAFVSPERIISRYADIGIKETMPAKAQFMNLAQNSLFDEWRIHKLGSPVSMTADTMRTELDHLAEISGPAPLGFTPVQATGHIMQFFSKASAANPIAFADNCISFLPKPIRSVTKPNQPQVLLEQAL